MRNPNPDFITDEMWRLWTDRPDPNWKLSGIYAYKPGYHNTVKSNLINWPGHYSIQLPLDLVPQNRDKARAIDLTMSTSEMIKWTSRMMASAFNPADHRLAAVKEFYGTLDGKTVVGLSKNNQNGPWRKSTADKTHLWHGHVSIFTLFVNNWKMLRPLLSVWKGEALTEWNVSHMQLPQLGDKGEVVRFWQDIHNRVRSTVTPAAPLIRIDGDYGEATAAAFLDFWKKCGGVSDTYKGTYVTAWLAVNYLETFIFVNTKGFLPEDLKKYVTDWLTANVAGKKLRLTGEVEGVVIPE